MNLIGTIYAIRHYGLRGIFDFLLRRRQANEFARFLRQKTKATTPQSGITIIGTFDQPTSLSKVLRDFARMLKLAGIPYQALNIPCKKPIPESEFADIVSSNDEFTTNKFVHIITMRQTFPIPDKRCLTHVIELWEFEDGLKEAQPETMWIKNIIAMSDFNFNTFQAQLPHAHISKILYPFQFLHGKLSPVESTRQKYGIPDKAFAVFFNFDFCSSYFRKNPEGILLAFSKAFSHTDNAILVFKTMRAQQCQTTNNRLHNLAKKLKLENKLITIDNFIPQEDIVNLTNACDVYMSLHRGEGFGLGIAEAMSLGKAIIVTDYSATTEFCNERNSIPIPFSMATVRPDQIDVIAYKHVSRWAEPDVDAAATALMRLYKDTKLRKELGNRAKLFIEDFFSVENFRLSIENFLSASPVEDADNSPLM